jgi:excisionase family DNA binding protein
MTAARKPKAKGLTHRATAALAMPSRKVAATTATSGSASKNVAGQALAVRTASRVESQPPRALKVTIEVDPLVDIVRRHVHLTPSLAKVIKSDFVRLFQDPALRTAPRADEARPAPSGDPVLSTQEAADLVGVSRPYIVARIEAGDIPLHQQVGNQRRVLKSDVLAWKRREQLRRRRALGQLGADLDSEIFAG